MNELACDTDPPKKNVRSGGITFENMLQNFTNSNIAVFANWNFNFSMNSNKKKLHEMSFFSFQDLFLIVPNSYFKV